MKAAVVEHLPESSFARPSSSELDQRAAPRFTSLIRAAKLVTTQGEFVCVLRDVSATGVRLRCFHAPPVSPTMALELQNGETFEVEHVRSEGQEASFRFLSPISVASLVQESWLYPRRQLRLNLAIPLSLRTATGAVAAITENISQQGCRAGSMMPLALSQSVIIDSPHLPAIRAKVRWRRDGACGLVFDDTFSLTDFAQHTARLQSPGLMGK